MHLKILFVLAVGIILGGVIIACYGLTPLSKEINAQKLEIAAKTDVPPRLNSQEIFQKMLEKYRTLKNYESDATTTFYMEDAEGDEKEEIRSSVKFEFPGNFKLNWVEPLWRREPAKSGVWLENGIVTAKLPQTGERKFESLSSAIDVADGVSKGTFFVGRLIVNEPNIVRDLETGKSLNLEVKEEKFGEQDCYVLSWEIKSAGLNHWIDTIWLRKQDYIISKYKRVIEFDAFGEAKLTTEEFHTNIRIE
jgi:outer membrane lipoprotein-sorting protein